MEFSKDLPRIDFDEFYIRQAGGGDIIPFMGAEFQRGSGRRRDQRGAGLGAFLGGLFRMALPVLKRAGVAIGREALNAGGHLLNDVENHVPMGEAFSQRLNETKSNLKRGAKEGLWKLMTGQGRKQKTKRGTKNKQSASKRGRRKFMKRKLKGKGAKRRKSRNLKKGGKRKIVRKTKKSRHRRTKREIIGDDIFSR